MAHRKHGNAFDDAMELLIENGFDGMADVLRILLNEAMKIEREDALAAGAYQRTPDRKGYANGFMVLARLCPLEILEDGLGF